VSVKPVAIQYLLAQWFESIPDYHAQATGICWWLFLCASHAHIKESLSVVSLGKPLTFGGFAVRQAHA